MKRKTIIWLVAGLLIVAVVAAIGFLVWRRTQAKSTLKTAGTTSTLPVNHVENDPIGLKFDVVKDFTPIDATTLKQLSPLFVYGYSQPDVNNVMCAVSQTKRTSSGKVAPDVLAAGTFKQIKTSFPDVQSLDYQAITLKNGQTAAYIFVSYHNNKTEIKQEEIIVATDSYTTFALCTSPSPLFDYYRPKFNVFLISLEVY